VRSTTLCQWPKWLGFLARGCRAQPSWRPQLLLGKMQERKASLQIPAILKHCTKVHRPMHSTVVHTLSLSASLSSTAISPLSAAGSEGSDSRCTPVALHSCHNVCAQCEMRGSGAMCTQNPAFAYALHVTKTANRHNFG